jgi:guanosine-3',5'-bis(diphosphate) 3'-pyrophosphohydrolase
MKETLETIKQFADKAHGDQKRKYLPERYIEHPVRVMKLCESVTSELPVLAAALLHDVLEDTEINKHYLHDFLLTVMDTDDCDNTLQLVIELTEIYTRRDYPQMSRRKRKSKEAGRISHASAEAQTIKYADIMDNCKNITTQDPDFAPVFLRECKMLLAKMTKGNHELRQQALQVIETERTLRRGEECE